MVRSDATQRGPSAAGRLAGKVALISGGASGIGAETCRRMAAAGARVAICDLQGEAGAKLAAEIGDDALFKACDVRQEADWREAFAAAEARFGRVDIVMNCAGVSISAPIDEASLEHWQQVMATNADGVFLGCKVGVEALRRAGGGSIINVSSILGERGSAKYPAYGASKAAVRLLSKSVALRCAEQGWNIRCNAILPGAIETPIMDPQIAAAGSREAVLAGYSAKHPMGRVGHPQEVAHLAVFLASDEASFITGAEIPVDGGYLA